MIPSANPTPHPAAQAWSDLGRVPAASCSGLESRYSRTGRQQDWEWENAMLLAQHSAHGCIGDQEGDFKPSIMQAEAIAGPTPSSFQYDALLSTGVNSSSLNLPSNTWSLLSTGSVRNSGGLHENSSPGFQPSSSPYYGSLGATGVNGYTGTGLSLYGDPRSNILGLVNLDQRRMQDLTKRESYTMADFNSRIGLNLGGRTYFSTDDYGFGRFGRRPRPNSPGAQAPLCQAEGCKSDLSIAKHYHRRHKVCEFHSKAATVIITGKTQRFCQQCSRFHVLSEFDDGKRSCRKRLADHNRRRRKPQMSPTAAASSTAAQSADQKNETEKATASEIIRDGAHSNGSPAASLPLSLVSAVPLATPVSHVAQEAKQQVTIFPENTDQKEVDQNFVQGCRSGGPSLSLTSLGRGQHVATSQNQSTEETIYEGMDVSVPWLRPGNSRSNNTEAAVGTRSSSSSMAHIQKADLSTSQDASSSIQILLPLQMSSDEHIGNSASDWVMKTRAQAGNEKLEGLSSSTLSGIRRMDDKDENVSSQHSQQTITHNTFGISEQPLPSSNGLNGISDNQLVTGSRLGIKLSGLQDLNPLNRSIYSSNPMV